LAYNRAKTTTQSSPRLKHSTTTAKAKKPVKHDPLFPSAAFIPLIVLLTALWIVFIPTPTKIRSIFSAFLFAPVEFMFYTFTTELSDGSVIIINPFTDPRARKGHTTWHQFCVNILMAGPVLDFYLLYFSETPLTTVLGWPLFTWGLEILEGYFLLALYGYNPAWEYFGSDALCHGTIKLSYVIYWWIMGAVLVYSGVLRAGLNWSNQQGMYLDQILKS